MADRYALIRDRWVSGTEVHEDTGWLLGEVERLIRERDALESERDRHAETSAAQIGLAAASVDEMVGLRARVAALEEEVKRERGVTGFLQDTLALERSEMREARARITALEAVLAEPSDEELRRLDYLFTEAFEAKNWDHGQDAVCREAGISAILADLRRRAGVTP